MARELKYQVITIGREYGAYGKTLGAALSEALGIPYYDKDLMRKVAEESGYSLEEIHKSGEQMSKATNFMNNFLNTMDAYVSSIDAIHNAEIEVIKKLAQKPCILIGRCADQVLPKEGISCFNIFLYADLAYRVAHAAELDENKGFTGNALVREVEKKSAGRATYYKHYTGKDIHSLSNYHICLDVGEIGVEKCREIILDLVTKPE